MSPIIFQLASRFIIDIKEKREKKKKRKKEKEKEKEKKIMIKKPINDKKDNIKTDGRQI